MFSDPGANVLIRAVFMLFLLATVAVMMSQEDIITARAEILEFNRRKEQLGLTVTPKTQNSSFLSP